jgi:hypothetical protein
VTNVTITGNMSWSTVNKYLSACKVVRNLRVQLLSQSDTHALLTDLALRDTWPDLPQLLQYIHISPVECISGVGHLFERIQESNASLQTLSLGLLSNTGTPISGISFNLIVSPAVLPFPIMICDDILTGTGAGNRSIVHWNNVTDIVIDGWVQRYDSGYESDEEPCQWEA